MFAGIFLLLFFIIWCFVDNFRRRDHHGLAKAGWTVLILSSLLRRPDLHHRPAGGRPTGPELRRDIGFFPRRRRSLWLPFREVQEPEMQNHHPKVTQRPDRAWVVECAQCRNDLASTVPIGIGMPLRDRETAERLRDNHAARPVRAAAS